MMSQRSLPSKPALQDESQSSGTRKTTSTRQPDQQVLKCPRCDSTNTKFCYYNNYSLTQPRHFCKTCRRYWTKGGALRNVPIGGGCRKNKKAKSSSKLTIGDSPRSSTSGFGGMKFFNGVSPSIDFQLGGGGLSFPRSCFPLDQTGSPNYTFMGLNYNNSLPSGNGECHLGPVIHQNVHPNLNVDNTSLASSIESLSSLNQDLHWKLQQQRLAMLFGDEQNSSQKDQTQKLLQPILFQNLEVPKQDSCFSSSVNPRKESTATGDATTEWFFGNSYAGDQMTTNTPRNIGRNASGSGWNGVQAWEDLHQYTALP